VAETRWVRLATAGLLVSLAPWGLVALAGSSAAVPDLGAGAFPVELGLGFSSATVSVLMAVAVLSGGATVLAGLRAAADGWRPRRFLLVALVGAVAVSLVPPVGSADHLSYAAYGRIAALGGDPYLQPPDTFAGGTDPVTSAVRDPWRSTTSVYGPVGALLMGLTSVLGGESVRATVWAWQLLLLLVWGLTALAVRVGVRDPDRRARAELLWTANPLLLTVGLSGAHADVLAGAAAVGALLLSRRFPFLAGLAVAVAVGTKAPYGAVVVGIVVAALSLREFRPGWFLRGVLGALVVLVPAHVWAGVHVYDQTRTASRYVSLATIWRPLVEAGLPRGALLPGMVVVMVVVAVLWWPVLVRGDRLERAAGATTLLAAGYLLGAAYELPWYDLLLWGPLAFALLPGGAPSTWTRVLTARLTLLALAYVPGLVDGMSPAVEAVTLGYRKEVGPWISWVALVLIVACGVATRSKMRLKVDLP